MTKAANRNRRPKAAKKSGGNGRRGVQGKPQAAARSNGARKVPGAKSRGRQGGERSFAAVKAAANATATPRSGLLCPVEQACGACQLLGVPYAEQLSQKQRSMESLFAPFVDDRTVVRPIVGMDQPTYYRNKVMTPYAPGRVLRSGDARRRAEGASGDKTKARSRRSAPRREILCGMYQSGTHRIVATDECLLENQVAKRIVLAVRDLMPRFRIEPYDEDALTGFLRHAVVRVGHTSGEVLLTLVTNGDLFPGSKNFVRELVKRCPEITTVVQNVNTRNTNVVLGDEGERTLYGPGFILDRLCGLSFRISSRSFYQVNAVQTEVLYRRAIEMAGLTGGETVLDAYCGTGTIGLVAAKGLPLVADGAGPTGAADGEEDEASRPKAARVIGVDNVASAIADARTNAAHNRVGNVEFVTADAGEFMREKAACGETIDVLLMDPPRSGASEEFLSAVKELMPYRIVYVSCNPKTQARDVSALLKAGYHLDEVQPVDMFPHTEHVENIVALTVVP